MSDDAVYTEQVSSRRTQVFFAGLTGVCLALALWRASRAGWDGWAVAGLVGAAVFAFYVVNFQTLVIRLTPQALRLTFGLFSWRVALENVAGCQLDALPAGLRLGGAGIHFMFVRGRYRVSLNFLEYPRVVVALRRAAGPVRDVSFSTRRPDEVIRLVQAAAAARR